MPWPFPNDAQTGTATIQLSHDFAISTAAGTAACPTLDAAVRRYQNQAVGLHVALPQRGGGGNGSPVLLRQLIVHVAHVDGPDGHRRSRTAHT